MSQLDENMDRPKWVILYAYFITIGSIFGLIGFLILYFTNFGEYIAMINLSPILIALSLFIFSGLGLLTGSGLLARKKFGWILAQFLLINILITSVYNLIFFPFIFVISTFSILLKYALIFMICGFIFYYFNRKKIITYYGMQREEANRIYLISFLASIMVLILSNFL